MFKKKKKKKSEPSPSPSSPQPSGHYLKLSEIKKATKNFDESLIIGRGCFGDVYLGEVFNGASVAIKRLNDKSRVGATDSWPEVERQSLTTLRHPNLVSLIGYCNEQVLNQRASGYEKETILVYEYIPPNTTLKDHLHELGTRLPWIERLEICIGVARGIHYLHRAGVMHGDIKSSNILLTESLVPKVTDFGLSKIGPTHDPSVIMFSQGSFGYIDRFFIFYGHLTMKSDVYSLGVVLLELLCRKPIVDITRDEDDPMSSLVIWVQDYVTSVRDLEGMIDSELMDQTSPKCLEEFFEISKRCMLQNPEKRPDVAEVLANLESLLTLQCAAQSVKEFTLDDLIKATCGFSQNSLLGETGLGKVFLGWVEHNTLAPSEEGAGIAVAVKPIASKIHPLHNDWLEDVNFLGQLAHPNIIRLLGCCSGDGHENFLVYEHMQKSLSHLIHGDNCLEPLSWGTRLNIMIGVARGLTYLYTKKYVLCNFQCDDILLDEDFNAKIGGFGWIEIQQRHDRKWLKGVFGYLKADYDTSTGHLPMNDVCSFGLVVLETITAKHPDDVLVDLESLEMRAPESKSNIKKLKKMMDPRLKDNYSPKGAFNCMALALRCIAVQPECRPSWEEIVGSLEQIYALNK